MKKLSCIFSLTALLLITGCQHKRNESTTTSNTSVTKNCTVNGRPTDPNSPACQGSSANPLLPF